MERTLAEAFVNSSITVFDQIMTVILLMIFDLIIYISFLDVDLQM